MDLTGIGSIAELAKGIVDRFFPPEASPEDKLKARIAIEETLAKRDEAKASIIRAELQQDDKYTKRARPTVVYGGLVMIAVNYVLFPFIGRLVAFYHGFSVYAQVEPIIAPLQLPTEFWVSWGGIVGTWVIGRSAEKAKAVDRETNVGKLISLITGNK